MLMIMNKEQDDILGINILRKLWIRCLGLSWVFRVCESSFSLLFWINSQVSKKFTPQVSSWFSTTKGMDCEEMTRD